MSSEKLTGDLLGDERARTDQIKKTILESTAGAAERLANRVMRHGARILRGRRVRMKAFEGRLYSRWAKALDLYELCVYLAQECGEYFDKTYRPIVAGTKAYKFEALTRLHGGAARIAGEIYTLLLAGYASGAHARWRTLHEIATTALFVSQESDDIAERYLHHRFVKSHEDALDYRKHAKRLNKEPLTDSDMALIEENYKAALARFGDDFKQPYGWAAPSLKARNPALEKMKRLGFQHVQDAIQWEHWAPYYRMASHAVHPTATFIRFNLGTFGDETPILAGPCNAGLADPAQGALIALTNATAALFTYDYSDGLETLDYVQAKISLIAMGLALHATSSVALDAFIEAHKELEAEEISKRVS